MLFNDENLKSNHTKRLKLYHITPKETEILYKVFKKEKKVKKKSH